MRASDIPGFVTCRRRLRRIGMVQRRKFISAGRSPRARGRRRGRCCKVSHAPHHLRRCAGQPRPSLGGPDRCVRRHVCYTAILRWRTRNHPTTLSASLSPTALVCGTRSPARWVTIYCTCATGGAGIIRRSLSRARARPASRAQRAMSSCAIYCLECIQARRACGLGLTGAHALRFAGGRRDVRAAGGGDGGRG